jgi:hypothetical protein
MGHISDHLDLISKEAEGTFADRGIEGAFLERHLMDISLSEGDKMAES